MRTSTNMDHNDLVENNQCKTIPFVEARHYFVKNSIPDTTFIGKITDNKQFDSLFGAAATMGTNGKPTSIDFSSQYVIAIILPTTHLATTITPISLCIESAKRVQFTFNVQTGSSQSYTITPLLIIVVENSYNLPLIFNRLDTGL